MNFAFFKNKPLNYADKKDYFFEKVDYNGVNTSSLFKPNRTQRATIALDELCTVRNLSELPELRDR